MSLQIGDEAPNFTANTTLGEVNLHEWLGDSWVVLMSHPADFTPVCTTEIGRVANLKGEFTKRNTKVLVLSVGIKEGLEPLDSHNAWIKDVNETQNANVDFPLVEDPYKKIADTYGMIHPNSDDKMTVRSVFIIAPDKSIKLMITYPASTGRNFDEILRVIDSLQLTVNHSLATPANWNQGDDVIIAASVSDEEASERFPDHVKVKPYLRVTGQPNL